MTAKYCAHRHTFPRLAHTPDPLLLGTPARQDSIAALRPHAAALAGHCPAVGKRQWLALKGSNGGFALQKRGQGASGGTMAVKALSTKSFLKKSQERSSSLPADMKQLGGGGYGTAY